MVTLRASSYGACRWQLSSKVSSSFHSTTPLTVDTNEFSNEGEKVLVVHAGSANMRIGRASDSIPLVIPSIVARRVRKPTAEISMDVDNSEDDGTEAEQLESFVDEAQQWIKTSLKTLKLRPLPQSTQNVIGFNEEQEGDIIAEHNDPYTVDWTEYEPETQCLFGESVLRLPETRDFIIRRPFRAGGINMEDYSSVQEWMADIEKLFAYAFEEELEIQRGTWKEHSVLLIIPDLFQHQFVSALLDVILQSMSFKSCSVLQESVCATYGAGTNSALVVDIGAEKVSVACVEDGYCIPESRINLKYGADMLDPLLLRLLKRTAFPYAECDLRHRYDRNIIQYLKQAYSNLQLADLSVQTRDCYVHTPHSSTRLYKFRVYDEFVMTPLALFYPSILFLGSHQHQISVGESAYGDFVRDFGNWVSACPIHSVARIMNEASSSTSKSKLRKHVLLNPDLQLTSAPEPAQPSASKKEDETEGQKNETADAETTNAESVIEDSAAPSEMDIVSENEDMEGDDEASASTDQSQHSNQPLKDEVLPGLDHAIAMSVFATSAKLMDHLVKKTAEESRSDGSKGKATLKSAVSDATLNMIAASNSLLPEALETAPGIESRSLENATDTESVSTHLDDVPSQQQQQQTKTNVMWTADEERIRKLLNSILLIGGGFAYIPGAAHVLADRVMQSLPIYMDMYGINADNSNMKIEKVNVHTSPRDLDPSSVCWKGGSVAARVDSLKEMCWFGREEYQRRGLSVVRERSLFPFAY